AIVQGGVWQNNYLNLLNESSTSSVYVSAASNAFGVSATPGSTFTGIVQITEDDSTYIIGNVSYFYPSEKSASLGTLFHDVQSTGLSIGGDVTEGIGLSVDVSAGRGWISRHVPVHDVHDVSWEDGYVNLSPNQTNYVVWDFGTESLNNQLSVPGHEQIILATVITSGSGIRFLHKTRTIVHDLPHILSDYFANTRNIALVSGITASIGSTQTQFSISPGSYYRVLDQIVFDGYVDVNFSYFYGTDGANQIINQNQVDIANYDNSGVLTPMSDGYYRSDTVYLTSDGRVSVIYGIAQYLTKTEAENSTKLFFSIVFNSYCMFYCQINCRRWVWYCFCCRRSSYSKCG
ncbi:MAG: hypothetical protein HC877_23620, partial [Thioploca sp.]|nr:hypothetical protein [Thioploca sp.]